MLEAWVGVAEITALSIVIGRAGLRQEENGEEQAEATPLRTRSGAMIAGLRLQDLAQIAGVLTGTPLPMVVEML